MQFAMKEDEFQFVCQSFKPPISSPARKVRITPSKWSVKVICIGFGT